MPPSPVHAKSSPSPRPCPSADVLELLALGKGSTDEVRFHVEACDSCRLLMDEIRTNEQFLESFRPALGSGGFGSTTTPRPGSGADAQADGAGVGGGLEPTSAWGGPPPGSGSRGSSGTGETPTSQIPGYHSMVEVSRGGQGIVYRAVHSLTKRKVAIKMLLRGAYASARELHRFEREIEIVAALRHANIVTVFDSGVTADGRPYVVMEYIHGLPLDRYIKEKLSKTTKRSRMLYEPHLRLFAKVAVGVQHAHSRGVIHRDLKPGNILVDDAGEPRIVDFGMARALSLSRGLTPTMTHEFGGTLAYASPEQVGGDPERIDIRTDVYSLGVILYELLTGEYPYDVSGPISEVVRNIEEAAPVKPSSIEPTISYEVETIILKALAKEPERRYQSAGELARDIEDHLTGRPILARSDSAWYVMRKLARRHKMSVIAGCMVMVLVAGAAAAGHAVDRANAQRAGVNEGMKRIMMKSLLAHGSRTPREKFLQVLDAMDKEVSAAFVGAPADEADVRYPLGMGYWEIGENVSAETQLKRVLELREAAGAPLTETVGLRLRLAWICSEAPGYRTAEALAYLNKDVVAAIRASGDRKLLAETLLSVHRTTFVAKQKDAEKQNATLEPAKHVVPDLEAELAGLAEAKASLKGVDDAQSLMDSIDLTIASVHMATGKVAEALVVNRELYERARTRHGDRHLETAGRLDTVADCEMMLGNAEQALALYQQAHAEYERLLIPPDRRLIRSLTQMAYAQQMLTNTVEAGKLRDRAKAMQDELERGKPER